VTHLVPSGSSFTTAPNWPFETARSGVGGVHGAFDVVVSREDGVDWVIAVGARSGHLWVPKLNAQNKNSYGPNWPHEQITGSPIGYAVAVDSGSNVIVAGTEGGQLFVRKLTPAGGTVWTQNALAGADCEPPWCDVAVDSADHIAVAGSQDGKWAVIKLNKADGSKIWTSTPDATTTDGARAVATTGTYTVATGDPGFLTAKLDQAGCI
jgi:hypothetical protein